MENLNFMIGKNLQILRKKNSLTQAELAEKLNYSDKAISKWEKGESMPDIMLLPELCQILGITADALLEVPMPRSLASRLTLR